MSSPLISIIVPVYNVEQFFPRCLKSLSAQTYKNLEIILLDDGSTDSSGKLCDDFARKNKSCKVFHTKNRGLSAARNLGLKHATGKYITFVDADDEILPDYVEFLYKLCKTNHTKMSVCGVHELRDEASEASKTFSLERSARPVVTGEPSLRPLPVGRGVSKENVLLASDALSDMLLDHGFTCVAYAKLYEKSLWNGIKFPVGKLHEDLGTTYKLIMYCDKIAINLSPKYIYHKHKNSLSTSAFSKHKLDIITLTDKMCRDIRTAYSNNITLRRACRIRRVHARLSVLKSFLNIGAYLSSHRQS